MSDDGVGLPEPARRAILAHVSTALATLERRKLRDLPDPTVAFIRAVDGAILAPASVEHGYTGVFEVAWSAMSIVAAGTRTFAESPLRYHDPDIGDDDPVSMFGTAYMRADRAGARRVFDRLQPDQSPTQRPTPQLQRLIYLLLSQAWRRQGGAALTMTLEPGDKWPPQCDFCCGPPARWMFNCAGADLRFSDGNTGPINLRNTDSENWYACNACRPHIEAHPVRWAEIYARLRHNVAAPRLQPFDVYRSTVWDSFQKARKHRRARALPAEPPPRSTPPPR